MILAELLYGTGAFVVSLIVILIPIIFGACIFDFIDSGGSLPEPLYAFAGIASLIEFGALLITLLGMFGK